MLKIIFATTVASLLAACASAPIEIKPFDKSVTTESDFNESWSKLVQFVSTNDINVGTIERDSGLITLSGDSLSPSLIREYCDATPPFLWTLTGGVAKGSILMVEEDGFVTTTVNARFSGTSYTSITNPPQYTTRPCNSRGSFEAAVLGAVQ
jgi:hypothetical protein